jgi:hypothetical protein
LAVPGPARIEVACDLEVLSVEMADCGAGVCGIAGESLWAMNSGPLCDTVTLPGVGAAVCLSLALARLRLSAVAVE